MLSKLVRIGKDAELRSTPQGKSVIGLYCVYDVGYGENKKPQWIEVAIWGKQAEALAQYLLKGKQIVVHADDVAIEEYQKNDGTTSTKLKCRAINIELAGSKQDGQQGQQQPQRQAQQQRPMSQQAAPQQSSQEYRQQQQQQAQSPAMQGYASQENTGFVDDFDNDSIPF